MEPRYVTSFDAAKYLGLPVRSFRYLVRQGKLPKPIRLSEGTFRWDLEILDKYMMEKSDD